MRRHILTDLGTTTTATLCGDCPHAALDDLGLLCCSHRDIVRANGVPFVPGARGSRLHACKLAEVRVDAAIDFAVNESKAAERAKNLELVDKLKPSED